MLWEYLACLGKSTVCAPKSHGLETLMAPKTSSTVAKSLLLLFLHLRGSQLERPRHHAVWGFPPTDQR
ncbi:unnamed protein product [Tenebrio molitor]|nr:unnamed protein product [Tenebrio molitor]